MFADLTIDQKIDKAKSLVDRIVAHSITLLRIHYSNRELVGSEVISNQIRRSYGANTFNLLCKTQYQFEILRLYALWETASKDRESIPTLIKLINDPKVIDKLQILFASQWDSSKIRNTTFGDDVPESER